MRGLEAILRPLITVWSIRARLTFWYGAVLGITLTFFGLFVYVTLERNLVRQTDQALIDRAQEVNNAVVALQLPIRGERIVVPPNVDAFSEAGTFVQIVDFGGNVASASDNLSDAHLPYDSTTLAFARARHTYHETAVIGKEQLRLYNTPLLFAGQSVALLQVGRSMRPVEAALEQLRLLMLAGGLASIVVSGLIGSALARAALRPIDRLTHTARLIGVAQDFGRRVAHRGPTDEVGRLAGTFNEMLSRLQEAYGRVEAALAAQRRFVADASHELRTPLTTIRGNAALLRRFPHMEPRDREEALQQIGAESERMSRLVSDLLTLARADAGLHLERQSISIQPIVQDVARQLHLLANGRVIDVGPLDDGHVRGDADYLKQLILILADNAIKYTPEGGNVAISTAVASDRIEIRVADTGVGIAREDIDHIFDRFYRADHARTTGGTGLGLAIASWIVAEHGGEIAVQSEPGKGTIFRVSLPLVAADPPFPPQPSLDRLASSDSPWHATSADSRRTP